MCKEIQTVLAPGESRPAPQLPRKQRGLGMMSLDAEAEVWGMGCPATLLGPDGAVSLPQALILIANSFPYTWGRRELQSWVVTYPRSHRGSVTELPSFN